MLSKQQRTLLKSLGLPTNFSRLSSDDLFAIDDALYEEMMEHGIAEDGEGLNDHGRLCESIIEQLPG